MKKQELEEKLRLITEDRDELASSLHNRQVELSELLFGKVRTYGIDSNAKRNWKQIFGKIGEIQGKVITQGQILPMIDHEIKDENTKLWYMIRVAMGDKGREEPVDPITNQSKFKHPNFN